VRVPDERRSLLSPNLELELRESEAGTVLHGRFSPPPNVWTGFMGLFFLLGMLGSVGSFTAPPNSCWVARSG